MQYESRRARLEQHRGKQGFVILNAEVREEGLPRNEEKDAGNPRAHAAIRSVRVSAHDFSWRVVKRDGSILPMREWNMRYSERNPGLLSLSGFGIPIAQILSRMDHRWVGTTAKMALLREVPR
jgi:hypothetical protein